jgi:hypothetical protein
VGPDTGDDDAGAPPSSGLEDAGPDGEQQTADAGLTEDSDDHVAETEAPDATMDAPTEPTTDADGGSDVVADLGADTADVAASDAEIDGMALLDGGIDGEIDGGIDGGWLDGGIDGGIDVSHTVTYVEVTVSGPALAAPITIPLVRQSGGASGVWGAVLGGIPVGTNYVFMLRAYDERRVEVVEGVTANVVIEQGKTTEVTIEGFEIRLGAPGDPSDN